MTRLSLISHAGTKAERLGVFPVEDEPAWPAALTKLGPVADAAGRFDRLWSAPERRARQAAAAFGAEARVVPELRDADYGSWRGRDLATIEAADPAGADAWLADPDAAPHGGESLLDLLRRVGAWLDGLSLPGHTVAITHPSVIRAAIIHGLGAPPGCFWRVDVEPLFVTDLRRRGASWTLRSTGPAVR
jgi:broad specificity phosphatase PhoE